MLYLLSMLNLSFFVDILIVKSDKNKGSQNWKRAIWVRYRLEILRLNRNFRVLSIYLDTLIVLDLSDNFEIQLSLSR
ncbi:unnamed protein product [Blepharisma stoltei]|uniref:Uncharacterized protein n=1 Tax=Blepharisma stoltei TaxID=1481888 RepID=A0AAU9K563_9CILI|nr:unnamed protein product [Blepharisma stoltei]